jgi:Ser/Thr protein kinase RdoA (MazF antagonist)
VSLWTWVPQSPARPATAEAAETLARLHAAAAGFAGDLPVLAPLREQISDSLDVLEREKAAEPQVIATLRDLHARIVADLDGLTGPAVVLHGDAQPGNLVCSDAGWLWLDLEETCRGPREFDLAVLTRRRQPDVPAALAAYAHASGTALPDPDLLPLFWRARDLEGAVWTLGMAHQYPDRYLIPARDSLARVLGTGD